MTSHEDWFRELRKPDQPKYIKTRDDMTHPIQHVENVPFGYDGKQTYLKNVLHVPIFMKSLVLVGQIVEQGMHVRFNNDGCFIEKEGELVAHDRREGQMFILESNEVKWTMFAKGLKVKSNVKLCHKRIDKQTYLKNVLHVPTITKNLVSVGQILELGMQGWFNNDGCFVEKHS